MNDMRIIRLSFGVPTSAATPLEHRRAFAESLTSAIRLAESISEFSKAEADNLVALLAEREDA